MFEEVRLIVDNLDAQAFAPSAANEDGVELAAFYTLQHGLAGHAEQSSRDLHCDVSVGAILDELATQCIGDSNAPGRAGCGLFAGDEAVVDPAMQGRRCCAENTGCLTNAEQFPVRALNWRYEAGNLPVATQIADEVLVETQAMRGQAPLRVENARDGRIGVMLRQSSDEGKRVFVCTNRGWSRTRQCDVTLGDLARRASAASGVPGIARDEL